MSRCIDQRLLLKESSDGDEGRSQWIESKLIFLANNFAIDVLSYAIMGNHTHSVLYVNYGLLNSWNDSEVLQRRLALGKIPDVCHLFLNKQSRTEMSEVEITIVLELVAKYRGELSNISRLMQRLNSYIALRANKEDGRKGHFWEGRFASQALLNEDAILACMAYVDLNPIRAGFCKTLIQAKHTSIRRRLLLSQELGATSLLPFRKSLNQTHLANVCLLSLSSYVEIIYQLVENEDFEDSLLQLSKFITDKSNWKALALDFEGQASIAAGDAELVKRFEKQARKSSYVSETKFKNMAASILSALRDIQYRSDKTHLPN